MTKKNLSKILAEEVRSCEFIIENSKEPVIKKIRSIAKRDCRTNLFDCKMILFRNRYSNVEKNDFMNWLDQTHLKEYLECEE